MVVTKIYPGSQSNLYLVAEIITENVRKRLARFKDFKPLYTEAFLDDVEAEAKAAAAMPDEATRALGHESVRADLVIAAALCLKRWRSLKRYCATAFPENTEMYWNSAGWENYEAAANQSWDSVKALCVAGQGFIADNATALMAGNNMPEGFSDLFDSDFAAFGLTLKLFYQREEAAMTGTEAKITANNNLYRKVIDFFCLDGQHIFEDEGDAVQSEYSYEAVSELVNPKTFSELVVETVKDEEGVSVPMAAVEVSIVGTDKKEATNAQGKVDFTQLAEGTIKVKLAADGFEERLIDVTLTGTRKMLKVVMVPLFEGEMKVGSEETETVVPVVG